MPTRHTARSSRRLIRAVALPAALVAVAAAAPAAQALEIRANESDNNLRLRVRSGDTIRLSLSENPSTGFGWRFAPRPARRVLRIRSNRFVAPPQTSPPTAGAPGRRIVVLRASGRGRTRFALKLFPPGGGRAARTFQMAVTVR